jgi:hypothetical protein
MQNEVGADLIRKFYTYFCTFLLFKKFALTAYSFLTYMPTAPDGDRLRSNLQYSFKKPIRFLKHTFV